MRSIMLADILVLVDAHPRKAEERLEKMYEWYYDRSLNIAKMALGGAGSLLLALLLGFLKNEFQNAPFYQATISAGVAVLAAAYGFWRLYALRKIQTEFVNALRMLERAQELAMLRAELPALRGP